jgi:uncharacterized protein (TIGR03435 family)
MHVSAQTINPYMRRGVLRGGRYEVRTASMVDLIRTAYGLDDNDRVVGGPSWLDANRFDIIAKAPQSTSQENLMLMLQALLADRLNSWSTRIRSQCRSLSCHWGRASRN